MEIPSSNLASDRLLPLGAFHLACLSQTAALSDLHDAFAPVQAELEGAAENRLSALKALIPVRVTIRFAERGVERALRGLNAGAVALDGKAGGPIQDSLFPNGLNAETRPRTAKQVDAAQRVLNRLHTASPAEPLRASHEEALIRSTNALSLALDARKAAYQNLGVAIAAELASRDDFVRAYDANAGAIRQRFPKDRETQDLYFDAVSSRKAEDAEEEGAL